MTRTIYGTSFLTTTVIFLPPQTHKTSDITLSCLKNNYQPCTNCSQGVVTIPPGCTLKSLTKIIYSSWDVTSHKKKFFIRNTPIPVSYKNSKPGPQKVDLIEKDESSIFSDLRDMARSLIQPETYQNNKEWILITIILMIICIVIGVLWRYYYKRVKTEEIPTNSEQPSAQNLQVIYILFPLTETGGKGKKS